MSVSVATLLSLAVALISVGVSLIKEGQLAYGALCAALGVAIMYAAIVLHQRGIITRLRLGR